MNKDRVPEFQYDTAQQRPEQEITIRIAGAISDKLKQVRKYKHSGVVGTQDRVLIAISTVNIWPFLEWKCAFGAVYPVGSQYVRLDLNEPASSEEGYLYQSDLLRSSGSSVSKSGFVDHSYREISALLVGNRGIANTAEDFGSDLTLIHNLSADLSLQRGWFPKGTEVWVERTRSGIEWHTEKWNE